MILSYPAIYSDKKGTEHSFFLTDGESLTIKLRGVEFKGHFWELEPVQTVNPEVKSLFDFEEFKYYSSDEIGYSITDFQLKVQIPIKVVTNENI